MRELPKRFKNLKKNKEQIKKVSTICNKKNCKYELSADKALEDLENYRRSVKFDGGSP